MKVIGFFTALTLLLTVSACGPRTHVGPSDGSSLSEDSSTSNASVTPNNKKASVNSLAEASLYDLCVLSVSAPTFRATSDGSASSCVSSSEVKNIFARDDFYLGRMQKDCTNGHATKVSTVVFTKPGNQSILLTMTIAGVSCGRAGELSQRESVAISRHLCALSGKQYSYNAQSGQKACRVLASY